MWKRKNISYKKINCFKKVEHVETEEHLLTAASINLRKKKEMMTIGSQQSIMKMCEKESNTMPTSPTYKQQKYKTNLPPPFKHTKKVNIDI